MKCRACHADYFYPRERKKMVNNVEWNITSFFMRKDSHDIEGLFLLCC